MLFIKDEVALKNKKLEIDAYLLHKKFNFILHSYFLLI